MARTGLPRTGRPPKFAANPYIILDPEDEHLLVRSWSFLYTPFNVYAVDQKRRLLHREIMQPPPRLVVDHLNGYGLDNRRSNLRVCTQRQNTVRAYPSGGVYPRGKSWVVQFGGQYLGGYPTKEEAEAVRQAEWERQVGAL